MRLKKRMALSLMGLILFSAISCPSFAKTDLSRSTPSELYQWKDWVLYGNEDAGCPTRYNNGNAYFCTWPTTLKLEIEKRTGAFNQQWVVFSETMVPLPGGSDAWPMDVTVDGKPVPVVSRNGLPVLLLSEGTHQVAGHFRWNKAPLMLGVPPSAGLISLTLYGQKVASPRIDEMGRLWLQKEETEKAMEDRYEAAVCRLIDDTIPMQITTRLLLNVSGTVREIAFPSLLFSGSVPTAIQSRLPVKIGENGEVTLQARPGSWDVRITSRIQGPVSELSLEAAPFETEIWSFQAQNRLRMVEIEGAAAIDPSQTDMPVEWQAYPAYLLKKGEKLTFKESRRGDPDPAPDKLTLHRTLWLDFDGKGFTVRDFITGTMSRSWYIALNLPAQLGRVSVDGQDMLITKQGPEDKPGIQLRKGRLSLEADLRYTESTRRISAVSWDHDFQSVSGTLNLPPGWRLFSAGGVDSLPGTWLQQWTLMDIFLVLIISVALFKLRSWKWGLVSLATLCLIYNEPGAPVLVWLFIVAAMALSKALPEGRFRRLVDIGGIVAVIVLLVISIPFMVQQIRWGVFPQLEPVRYQAYPAARRQMKSVAVSKPESPALQSNLSDSEFVLEEIAMSSAKVSPRKATEVYDPDALVQTGPGVPQWTWRSYPISWNGPVKSDQTIRLRLISPMGNLILSILRVLMLALLIFCVINTRILWNVAKNKKLSGALTAAAILGMLCLPGPSRAADTLSGFPSQDLLKELEKRLLEKNDCYPNCADIPELEITAGTDTLSLLFNVDAAIDTAIPLPVSANSWQPETILLDGKPIGGLSRENSGSLWALIPAGIHRLSITGSTRGSDDIQLPFTLKPHFTACKSDGWDVVGISATGSIGASIRLTRLNKNGQDRPAETFETSTIPAFLEVERTFHLGITWSVTTVFRYRADSQASVVISYPLIAGEAVTTAGVEVKNGEAVIPMAPDRPFVLESTFGITPEIRLHAPENVPWSETWILDASPIWNCDLSGISVIHHQDNAGQWQPTWMPWPGETVTIAVSRPEAIAGRSVTIDSARLTYTPGRRYHQADLALQIRTSRGGQHPVELPEGALLQQLSVDGKSLPVQQEGGRVSFPLQPGTNSVLIEWQQAASSGVLIKSPEVRIGDRAVNADVTFNMPQNRWILLTGGPRLGPAVLFWSYLMVVVLAAFCLKYVKVTPLKFRHWLLLGIGLTQVPAIMAIIVVAWFVAVGFRERYYPKEKWFSFNLIQIGLFILTLFAVACLYTAVQRGLLGIPDMQISGNYSTNLMLNWTQDRVESYMPRTWVVAAPIWCYHILMLLWSLWLSFSLIKWLRWGWKCFGNGGFWKKRVKNRTVSENSGSSE